MQTEIAARLTSLNRQFYQTFALQFSATRQRLQPGVQRVLEHLPFTAHLLDLGCGNGELARELLRRQHKGSYLGLDFSRELLAYANGVLGEATTTRFHFQQADLTIAGWEQALQGFQPHIVLAFAVLHHIPGVEQRRDILRTVNRLLPADGQFVFSVWQFLNSPRLTKRIQPWEAIGINAADVEDGDYLLDWRQGGHGLRYVHHFNQAELLALAGETGFKVSETFLADGEKGKLGLYQLWTLC